MRFCPIKPQNFRQRVFRVMAPKMGLAANEAIHIRKYIDSLCPGLTEAKRTQVTDQVQEYLRKLKSNEQALAALRPSLEVRYVATCDLALTFLGHHVKKEQAITASGSSSKAYQTFKALAGSLLAIKNSVTIKDVGLRLGLEDAIPVASTLLANFKSQFANDDDIPDDQFVACALYVTCRKLKLKRIPKRELTEVSKLKAAGFFQLALQMEPYCPAEVEPKQASKKRKATTMDDHQEPSTPTACSTSGGPSSGGPAIKEDYETFRMRILREAFNKLETDNAKRYSELASQYADRVPELFAPSPKKPKKAKLL